MEPGDVVDEVNELLRLGVGDVFRLEHIKQSYIHNKALWESDQKYLEGLREKYLVRIKPEQDEEEQIEKIHCWKCGKKNPVGGNYCTWCGAPMFEIGGERPPEQAPPAAPAAAPGRRVSAKKWAIVAVLAAAVAGGGALAYTQGGLQGPGPAVVLQDSRCGLGLAMEGGSCVEPSCGSGAVLDESGACVAPPCGPGLAYDPASASCVVPP